MKRGDVIEGLSYQSPAGYVYFVESIHGNWVTYVIIETPLNCSLPSRRGPYRGRMEIDEFIERVTKIVALTREEAGMVL